jgi:hypothetical protein
MDKLHRIVAPFAVSIEGDNAKVKANAGIRYEVLIDGAQTRSVASQGTDVVSLRD